MDINFEPTNSFCYRFARYIALPEILQKPEVASGREFRLIELVRAVIEEHLTQEQQDAVFVRPKAGGTVTVGKTIRFYVPFIAKNTKQLVSLGAGLFRMPDVEESDLEEAELEAEELTGESAEASELSGTLYAYTFPTLIQQDRPFPIKVGLASGDAEKRVVDQCRQAATFENPRVLKTWPTSRVRWMETAVHNTLRIRGKWREDAPGREWFDTTIEEVDSIVRFIEQR
ncbi:GIY-YIG nuclease family protein [Achromobacter mucicolens]|uniref:GIY-YIG nuclease family protein n=1 Tax=Achromobacter mucicolens TaxID=1389922 RepID=UPI002FE0B38C